MNVEVSVIFFLCLFIIYLLGKQKKHLRQQAHQELKDKVLQALSVYPVYQYSMMHMLERCLAIIFSAPQYNLLPKGAIYIRQKNELNRVVKRGLSSCDAFYQNDMRIDSYLAMGVTKVEEFHSLASSEPGQYLVPLILQKKMLGVLVIYAEVGYQLSQCEINFIAAIGKTVSNLIERKQFADELRLGNSVINLSQQAIFIADENNQIIRCNEACEKMTGYTNCELIGQDSSIFQSNYHSVEFYNKLWRNAVDKGFWQGEVWNKTKNGKIFAQWLTVSVVKDVDARIEQYIVIFSDLTEKKKAEKDIQQLSFFDSLTQLPNRALFIDRVKQAVIQAKKKGSQFALLCLDIDHFKKVNETFGHEEGDKLLQIFADRITKVLDKEGSLARIGGDEFAIIIHDLNEKNNYKLAHLSEQILLNLRQAVVLQGQSFIATSSIGISVFPSDADNAGDLIKFADSAMFQAKNEGRNSYQFYSKKLNQQVLRNIQIELALRQALKENFFELFLQPQFELDSHFIVGAEALIRVKQGMLSKVSPSEYIPIAEETDLIVEVGDWVFEGVCKLIKHWDDSELLFSRFNRVAINISPVQFKRADFVGKVRQCIEQTGVPVKYLEIELTEGSLQESALVVNKKLAAIKAMGISVAIDDFGTGYSSLGRLKQFPIDLLKIDRSFVSDICNNKSDIAIIKAIIVMANSLGIGIIAEGIETHAQVELLKSLKCAVGQGFSFSRPLNVNKFEQLMASSYDLNQSIPQGVS